MTGILDGVLDGIRVLELGNQISAPFCSKLLTEYGADVIKVEPPDVGEETRRMGPFVGDDPHLDKSIPFLYLNTNKRGVTLNFGTPTGVKVLTRLIVQADILIQNFTPSVSENLGLAFPLLNKLNPQLIVTSVTPFGQTGPYRDLAATDIVTYALSGLMYHSGDSDREPLRNALNQSFYVAGVNGAVATTAALFQRLATGTGQHVDVSTMECLASHLVQAIPYYNYMGATKGRRPVRGAGFEELMPAKDGYVIPSVQGSQPWSTVADLIGLEELQDDRFATGSGRIEHGQELNELLIKGLAQWDRKALFQTSGERRLVFGMAQDAGDLYQCPHLRERGFFAEVTHPVAGTADYPGMGPKLSEMAYKVRRPAPLLGQHNTEIFCDELGYSRQDLAQLRASGII